MTRLFRSALAGAALLMTSVQAQDTCYQVGYGLVFNTSWYPCNNTAPSSGGVRICCSAGDTCSQDGLCRGISMGSAVLYYNAGCTDGSYNDPICRNTCQRFAAIYAQYNQNTREWACCGSKACDSEPSNITFNAVSPQNFPLLLSTTMAFASSTSSVRSSVSQTNSAASSNSASSSSSSSQPSGSSASSSSSASSLSSSGSPSSSTTGLTLGASGSSSPSSSPESSGGLSTGAQAGIGVGVALGVLLLIAMGAIAYLRRRKQKANAIAQEDPKAYYAEKPPVYSPAPANPPANPPTHPAANEMDARYTAEMDARVTYELPSPDHRA